MIDGRGFGLALFCSGRRNAAARAASQMTVAVSLQRFRAISAASRPWTRSTSRSSTGEFFAMLGPSGSGKTTCLRLIAGFEQPTCRSHRDFRRGGGGRAALPAQRQHRVPGLCAVPAHECAGQCRLPADAEEGARGWSATPRPRRRSRWCGSRGYGDRRPGQLSGGQRQRVALARAIVNKPKVLLLDEPLGALDLKLRESMQEELKALQKTLGITFIFVTHDQGEALSMADRVAVFSDGQVKQIGTPEQIYKRPQLAASSPISSARPTSCRRTSCMGITGDARWASLRPEDVDPRGQRQLAEPCAPDRHRS